MRTEPTTVRYALDELLRAHPFYDVVAVDWQLAEDTRDAGPWVLVTLGQPSDDGEPPWARWEFAIWKRTGDVYAVQWGLVGEEPIIRGVVFQNERSGSGRSTEAR